MIEVRQLFAEFYSKRRMTAANACRRECMNLTGGKRFLELGLHALLHSLQPNLSAWNACKISQTQHKIKYQTKHDKNIYKVLIKYFMMKIYN